MRRSCCRRGSPSRSTTAPLPAATSTGDRRRRGITVRRAARARLNWVWGGGAGCLFRHAVRDAGAAGDAAYPSEPRQGRLYADVLRIGGRQRRRRRASRFRDALDSSRSRPTREPFWFSPSCRCSGSAPGVRSTLACGTRCGRSVRDSEDPLAPDSATRAAGQAQSRHSMAAHAPALPVVLLVPDAALAARCFPRRRGVRRLGAAEPSDVHRPRRLGTGLRRFGGREADIVPRGGGAVRANALCTPTGLKLEEGATYRLFIVIPAADPWIDNGVSAGP